MGFIGDFAIHGYAPVPPYPASHGCVREPIWACYWVYDHSWVGETALHLPLTRDGAAGRRRRRAARPSSCQRAASRRGPAEASSVVDALQHGEAGGERGPGLVAGPG